MVNDADSSPSDPEIRYDNLICRLFALATLFWGVVAAAAGMFVLCLRLYPTLFPGVHEVSYGRLQPLYPNLAIFGFAANAVFTLVYYSAQRLCRTAMWSSALSYLHFLSWQGIAFAMLWTLGHGVRQPRELAESEWPIDLSIAVVWIVFFAFNLLMTIASRREPRVYISLWFYLASTVTVGFVHILGNVVTPGEGWTSTAMLSGVPDAMVQSWYRQNFSGFLLVFPMLGAMYHFLPKISGQPIYSYRFAVIQFWALVLLYGWTALRPLHYSPIPDLAGSLAVVSGLILWMPQWGGVLNGWFSFRGVWKRIASEPSLAFLFVGVICFALLTLQETLSNLRSIAAVTQFTDWTAAQREVLVYGFNGMMAMGVIYWMMPRILNSEVRSKGIAKVHFVLALLSLVLIAAPLYVASVLQGQMWMGLDSSGQLAHPEFVESLGYSKFFWRLSMIGLGVFGIGLLLQISNFVLTWIAAATEVDCSEYETQNVTEKSVEHASALEGAPVLALAVGIDRMSTFEWHRSWERNPFRMCLIVLVCLGGSSLLLLGPSILFAEASPTPTSQPYTALELAGREIYHREGCYSCHSQTVRPLVAETKRYGEYSLAGQFAFDRPVLWGSQRIGPDLASEGGARLSYWHWQHLLDPRFEEKESVMPSFEHLFHERLDFDAIAKASLAEQATVDQVATEEENG
ncbi:MAG: cbb3-type cytochrome c oxidase subunit I, partial [Planctomycetota bacterium]